MGQGSLFFSHVKNPIIPPSFVKKMFFYPSNCFVENQLSICACFYFWSHPSVTLLYMPILLPFDPIVLLVYTLVFITAALYSSAIMYT